MAYLAVAVDVDLLDHVVPELDSFVLEVLAGAEDLLELVGGNLPVVVFVEGLEGLLQGDLDVECVLEVDGGGDEFYQKLIDENFTKSRKKSKNKQKIKKTEKIEV